MKISLFRIIRSLVVITFIWVIVGVLPASADIRYSITDLGPGVARDINNLGQVVGENFFWDPNTGRQNLSANLVSINDPGQAIQGQAIPGDIWDINSGQLVGSFPIMGFAINNAGQVAGRDGGGGPPCIWDSVNGKQCLNEISGWASDINDSGQICVFRGHEYESLVWDSVNGIQYIPTLGGAYSEALA